MKYYSGIGSRKTPENILKVTQLIAHCLEKRGYTLRSGGAQGADAAFEEGVQNPQNKQIYYAEQTSPEAMEIAAKYHPSWGRCSDYSKKLHGRNSFQVLGFNLNEPSEFLICWTPDGCTQHIGRSIQTGGTGTAISIAEAYGTRVCNLQRPDHYQKTWDWLKKEMAELNLQ